MATTWRTVDMAADQVNTEASSAEAAGPVQDSPAAPAAALRGQGVRLRVFLVIAGKPITLHFSTVRQRRRRDVSPSNGEVTASPSQHAFGAERRNRPTASGTPVKHRRLWSLPIWTRSERAGHGGNALSASPPARQSQPIVLPPRSAAGAGRSVVTARPKSWRAGGEHPPPLSHI